MIDRRTFLQQALLGLCTLGVTEAGIFTLEENQRLIQGVKNYRRTLAQTTNRKLALLVGIDRYPQNRQLNGCVTDVELQRELLIARFGFKPQDIITLCNLQATRENIENAFIEHLSEQAKVDDVVIFHFSGYGNQVKMPLAIGGLDVETSDRNYKLVNSLVPADAIFPTKGVGAANDLIEDTLLLLAQSLATDRLSIILDTSFKTVLQPLAGNLKVRSSLKVAENPSPEELAFQEQLQVKLAAKGISLTKRFLASPGMLITAAGNDRLAVEGQWNGFSAGLFTSALTQYLWHVTPRSQVRVALQRTNEVVERVMGKQQQPSLGSIIKPQVGYYTNSSFPHSAEAVVSGISNNSIELKLLGLPTTILNYYEINSCLSTVGKEETTVWLQIKSRDGFKAKAQLLGATTTNNSLALGQPLKEVIRIVPRTLGLTVALDGALERIERVDATSALANISAVSSVVIAGEQNADLVLNKVNKEPENSSEPNLPVQSTKVETGASRAVKTPETSASIASSSYALFSAGGVLIPNTQGAANEAVKSAINRLTPKFDNLLATKWLQLTINEFSSGLDVSMTLESLEAKNNLLLRRNTQLISNESLTTASAKSAFPVSEATEIPTLTKNTELQFKLHNSSELPLYIILLEIDAHGSLSALYTPRQAKESSASEFDNIALAPQTELSIPPVENTWQWKIADTPGMTEVYGIFSSEPFTQTLEILAANPDIKLNRDRLSNIPNVLAIVRGILQDLERASAVTEEVIGSNNDVYALKIDRWASLNFVYQVIDL
jgi:hypothetical protein